MEQIAKAVRNGIPFTGRKKVEYSKYIRDIIRDLPDDLKILDAFGGSGYISANIKLDFPNKDITLNDYDGLFKNGRLLHIFNTQEKIALEVIKRGIPINRVSQLSDCNKVLLKQVFNDILTDADKNDSVLLNRIMSPYVFSSRSVSGDCVFSKLESRLIYAKRTPNTGYFILYNKFILNTSIKILHDDVFNLTLNDYDVLILDPPYLNSEQKSYGKDFFGLTKTVRLLKSLPTGKKVLFFNQNKDDILSLLSLFKNEVLSIHTTHRPMAGLVATREDCLFYIQT